MNRTYSNRFSDNFPVTAGLLLVIVGFYVLELIIQYKIPLDGHIGGQFNAMGVNGQTLVIVGANVSRAVVDHNEYWRLLSCVFLHGGLIHLLFNSMALMNLGRVCEPLVGSFRFLFIYVVSGLAGSALSLWWNFGATRQVVSIGASGAICGLLGLLLGFSLRHKDRQLRSTIVNWLVYLAIFSVLFASMIDHAGHIGGILAGLALGWFVPRYLTSEQEKFWRVPGYAAIGVCVVGLGFAVWNLFQALMAANS